MRDQDEQRDPVVFVQELLNLRDKYGRFITESFRGAKNFEKVMKEAFEAWLDPENFDADGRQRRSLNTKP